MSKAYPSNLTHEGFSLAQKTLGGRAHFRLGYGVSPIGQRL